MIRLTRSQAIYVLYLAFAMFAIGVLVGVKA